MEDEEDQSAPGELYFLCRLESAIHSFIMVVDCCGLLRRKSFVYTGECHKEKIAAGHQPDRKSGDALFF